MHASGLNADCPTNREISMTLTKLMFAGTLIAAAPSIALVQPSAAQQSAPMAQQSAPVAQTPSAQKAPAGMVTTIDRINNTIVIRQIPPGTVGASNGGATDQQFSAAAGLLENVHAGDKVTYAVSENGGKKTITKIDRQP
jgi:hypothetical protein